MTSEQPELDLIVSECADRVPIEGRAALDELCDANPQFAAELRTVVERLIESGLLELPAFGPGTRIGSYELLTKLGQGGMGIVFEAKDPRLRRNVAIKVLHERSGDDVRFDDRGITLAATPRSSEPTRATRFVEEARIGGRLEHPGIVPVHDIGIADGRLFFAMKIVRGDALSKLLTRRSDPGADRGRFLSIFAAVCNTIAYAHSRGVLHRDIKPSNVMVGQFGEVQVVDWGMAKVIGSDEPPGSADAAAPATVRDTESLAGSVIGTPGYMPTEQARGEIERLSERSDVFALGAMLCEILTGEPPYVGTSNRVSEVLELARRGATDQALDRLAECDADAELIELCRECLATDPDDRPATGSDVRRRVDEHLAAVEQRAAEARIAAARAQVEVVAQRRARRFTLALAGSVTAIIAIIAGGLVWLERDAAARREATDAQVSAQLAIASEAARRTEWTDALAAVDTAANLADSTDVSPALRDRALELHATIHEDYAAANRTTELQRENAQLIAALEGVRQPDGFLYFKQSWVYVADTYESRLRDGGLDLLALDEAEAVKALLSRGDAAPAIIAHVDAWARAESLAKRNDRASRLTEIAARSDDDNADRNALRQAILDDDVRSLVEFADRDDLETLPEVSLQLLAEGLLGQGKRVSALQVYRRAQHRYPTSYGLTIGLARTLGDPRAPRSAEAVRYYTAALALRPNSVEVRHELASAFQDPTIRDHDRAIELLKEALELQPRDAHLWWHIGRSLRFQRRYADAAEAYAKSQEFDSNWKQALAERGSALLLAKKYTESIPVLRAALEFNAEDVLSHYYLATALYRTGEIDAAFEHHREAVRIEPTPRRLLIFATRLRKHGRMEEAIECYERAIDIEETGPALADLGSALWSVGRNEEAESALRRAVELQPNRIAYTNLGRLLMDASRFDAAFDAFQAATRLAPDKASVWGHLATAAQSANRFEDAIAAYRDGIKHHPEHDASWHFRLARLLVEKREFASAESAYRTAVRLQPEYAEAWSNLGELLQATGRYRDAVAYVEQGHELGIAKANWPYPSDEWVEHARELATAEPRLESILDRRAEAGDAAELWAAAQLAHRRNRNALAADLASALIHRYPNEDRIRGRALRTAAEAAVAAAADAPNSDNAARTARRKQARDCLRTWVEYWRTRITRAPSDRELAIQALEDARTAPPFEPIRAAARLRQLGAEERIALRTLWTDLENMLDELRAQAR